MPSSRRSTRSRASQLPVRVTSYRDSDSQRLDPPPGKSSAHGRTAVSGSRHTFTRTFMPSESLSPSSVTPERLSLTLPVPPSINHQYATVNGRRLLSSTGRAYKALVGRQIWAALVQSPARATLMDRLHSGPLALSIHFFFTSALRRDVDGGLKIAQDAVCEGLGLNDNRIIETHLFKQVDKVSPRIELSVSLAPTLSFHPAPPR